MGYDDVISDYGETGLRGVIRRDAIANLKALVKVLDEKLPGYKKPGPNMLMLLLRIEPSLMDTMTSREGPRHHQKHCLKCWHFGLMS